MGILSEENVILTKRNAESFYIAIINTCS